MVRRLLPAQFCAQLPVPAPLALTGAVHAATTWTVTSLADIPGACPDPIGCTLRQAITNAASGDTIIFSASGVITLGSILPALSSTLTVDGSGKRVTISGENSVGIFEVSDGGSLTLNDLTIANGSASNGGGIDNEGGRLTVPNSTVRGNTAVFGSGGGIQNNGGTVTVTNSTFSGNSAPAGGGIANILGAVRLANTILAVEPNGGNCANIGFGAITDLGGNVDDGNTCIPASSTVSLSNTNPQLRRHQVHRRYRQHNAHGTPPATNTTVSAASNPAGIGQSVIYIVEVTGNVPNIMPTGVVTFTDNGAPIPGCTAVPLQVVSGHRETVCSTSYTEAQVGTHSIVTTYSGDTNFIGSVSNTVVETVQGCEALATVAQDYSLLGMEADSRPVSMQYLTFTVQGRRLEAGNPTIAVCSNLGTANAQPSVLYFVRSWPGGWGNKEDLLLVNFRFDSHGMVTEVEEVSVNDPWFYPLRAPFDAPSKITVRAF